MKPTIVSGIQPTGNMHLGNYLGAVSNWVRLQDTHEPFFFIADVHALTTTYENPEGLAQDKLNLAKDLLACGVDPAKSCLFFQSDVPAHFELFTLFTMMTPLPWLERVPTYKDKIDQLQDKDLNTFGFLGYPVLQAADILLYKAAAVPVGKDQLPHLELTREIARRFNHLYGAVFPEPQDMLTDFQVLPGLDGRKMSKSYGNTIPISATEDETTALVRAMVTDPNRIRRTDPGNPEICPVFAYHRIFSPIDAVAQIDRDCRSAALGCVDCKKQCAAVVNDRLLPLRERRNALSDSAVIDAVYDGAKQAGAVATETLCQVKDAMKLSKTSKG
ncbi:MAG: tryptophan--tRNA ligase [Candidatus Margulisiibacteriota bacterium]